MLCLFPRAGNRFMCFNCGVLTEDPGGQSSLASARVLGMGWLSSVGVAQHLIRKLALSIPRWGADLPPLREIRKDRSLPNFEAGAKRFWSVYLDNSDSGEIAAMEKLSASSGEVDQWQDQVRTAYEAWGIPRGED